jgi:orotate phosphoribosyltransferase
MFNKNSIMETLEHKIAAGLLDIKAVKLSPENPFTWASGWRSPIYCDNRKGLSYPQLRNDIVEGMILKIKEKFDKVDLIAGVATGAIAYGVLVAEKLGLPFVYVRPKPKDHGMGNQVEGYLPDNANVVVIEDLISTGMSSLGAVDALTKAGAHVLGMVAIFSYNFPQSRRSFEYANVELHTLSDYDTLVDVALATKYIEEKDVEMLREWRYSPETWGK